MTGLGEKHHLINADINLTTHVDDVVNHIRFERLNNVVLVGHNYGGIAITGVMDRIPGLIRHAIFLDASAPKDGMSALDLWGDLSNDIRGESQAVYFPWLEGAQGFPRDVPHPHQTLLEAVSYKNPEAKKLNVTFVAFVPDGMTIEQRTQDPSWHTAKERGWTTRTFAGDHVIYREKPSEVAALLIESVADQNRTLTK